MTILHPLQPHLRPGTILERFLHRHVRQVGTRAVSRLANRANEITQPSVRRRHGRLTPSLTKELPVATHRIARLGGSYRQQALGTLVAAGNHRPIGSSSPGSVANKRMHHISNPPRPFGGPAGPVVISIRRIGPGEEERVFAYSGIEGARTVKLVLEQAYRLVAGLPGVCAIEVLTMERSDHPGRDADGAPRGKTKSLPRPSRSAAALAQSGRKVIAKPDGFDQPNLQRPHHRAAR
jgi:hypothetical protein